MPELKTMSRGEALEVLNAVRKTIASTSAYDRRTRNSIYQSCIASTLLVIAHTLIEKNE